MSPSPLVLQTPYIYFLVAACLWLAIPELGVLHQTRHGYRSFYEDRGSACLIVLAWPVLTGVAIWLGFQAAHFALPARPTVLVAAGIALMLLGGLLRRACIRHLGESFTGYVQTRMGQELVTSGPYRWLQHPAYSGAWLQMIGFGVALGNTLGLLLLALAGGLVYLYRARVEESAMLQRLGPAYLDYASGRKRFIPFLF
jgi:protein-S-isoprenylcysteine O-methyltransferase Ste14